MVLQLKLSSTADSPLLIVGRITKPHGLRGEVVVFLSTTEKQRVAPGSTLQSERGPLTIVSSRVHQDRFVVVFEGVDSREKADALRGVDLSAAPIEDPDALWVHEMIGQEVHEIDGTVRGVVSSVLGNPASDLLELEDGSLIPLRFVTEIIAGVIVVDPPKGLFDL